MYKEMKRPKLLRRISFPFCSPPSLSCKNQVFSDTSQVVFRIQEVRERVVTQNPRPSFTRSQDKSLEQR